MLSLLITLGVCFIWMAVQDIYMAVHAIDILSCFAIASLPCISASGFRAYRHVPLTHGASNVAACISSTSTRAASLQTPYASNINQARQGLFTAPAICMQGTVRNKTGLT